MIRAILKRVGEPGRAIEIEDTLEGLRGALGGGDELTLDRRACGNDYAIYFDDDGLRKELPLNMILGPWPLHGPVLFVGPVRDGRDTSLRPLVQRRLLALLAPTEATPVAEPFMRFRCVVWPEPRAGEAFRLTPDGTIEEVEVGYGELVATADNGECRSIVIGEPLTPEVSKRYVDRLMADALSGLVEPAPPDGVVH